jgi:surface polysaccharide O-acyltransferase-like enzyme
MNKNQQPLPEGTAALLCCSTNTNIAFLAAKYYNDLSILFTNERRDIRLTKQPASRNPAMDVIRCFALFTIVANHFYSYSGYLTYPMEGPVMYAMTLFHQVFLVTIPIYLMLSGYLMKNKKPTRSYYAKLGKTICIYLLASIFCMAYHTISCKLQGGIPTSIPFQIISIFSYTTVPYGWYINMYIGLFLIIPFLNVLYNNLDGQRSKQYLILSLLCLSSIPNVLNIFRFDSLQWWLQRSTIGTYHPLVPDWW